MASQNLVANGTFEVDATGWESFASGTVAASVEQAHMGAQSLKWQSGVNSFAQARMAAPGVSVLSGQSYTARVWTYRTEGVVPIQIRMVDQDGNPLTGTAATITTTNGSWVQQVINFAPPADVAAVRIGLIKASNATDIAVYLDDASIVNNSAVSAMSGGLGVMGARGMVHS